VAFLFVLGLSQTPRLSEDRMHPSELRFVSVATFDYPIDEATI